MITGRSQSPLCGRSRWTRITCYAGAAAVMACGGGSERTTADSQRVSGGEVTPARAESTAQPATAAAPVSPDEITPSMVALGDSIFKGQAAGGLCMTCHGADAKGTQLAPDLTDQQWLDADGSYASIVSTVTNGVPNPKQHAAPMPPKGGANLTDEQVRAVAAYVYSLSHPNVGH